eukprot:CAMPEP_0114503800 /NCGR_PEP_ID=MMETSP0109-20121206/9848_1 /TAXON_ID=29199 /ORGANISM="Chlorarachnion reptans, Strain CCCM449" /LENGTH=256 /DNA_ID=CAMNT_0001681867 /DNA_START=114 /DNA_END=884 /DNA_ORIENTATION=+
MSMRHVLGVHFNDYQQLVRELLGEIVSFKGDRPDAVSSKAEELVQKDIRLHETVKRIVEHNKLQNEIDRLKDEIQAKDDIILAHTKSLARIEQKLHEATIEEKDRKMSDLHGMSKKQQFTCKEVLVFAERLGKLSSQGFDDKTGILIGHHRPPAPHVQSDWPSSKLRYNLDKLVMTEFEVKPLVEETKELEPAEVEEKKSEEPLETENENTTQKSMKMEDDGPRTTMNDFMPFLNPEDSDDSDADEIPEEDSGEEI